MFDERRRAAYALGTLSPEDRRTLPRYPFTAAAEALDSQHRRRMNARTSDLGKGGSYADTFTPFPRNTGIRIRILCDKAAFMADAKVVCSKIGMGAGLAFTSIEPRQLGVPEKWIGELSGRARLGPAGVPPLGERGHSAASNGSVPKEAGQVWNELILALMRKGTLTEEEGKAMRLGLVHRDFML